MFPNHQIILSLFFYSLFLFHPIKEVSTHPHWPQLSPILIIENQIKVTSDFSFSFQRSQYGNKVYQTAMLPLNIESKTKYLSLLVDVGIVRMFTQNNQLLIYQGNNLRILKQVHKLEPTHGQQERLEIQVLYQLVFGNKAEYHTIGISYFIEQSDTERSNEFTNNLLAVFQEKSQANKVFALDNYFPLPQPEQIQNLYVFGIQQVAGLLWGIRRVVLKIPTSDFSKLKQIIGQEQSLSYFPTKNANVYAAKVRSNKPKQQKQRQKPSQSSQQTIIEEL